MEAKYKDVPRLRYESAQQWAAADPWTFILSGPLGAEDAFLQEVSLEEHTKMALARLVARETGADLRNTFRLTKDALLMELAGDG